ncbi:MAG: hypothetical protein EAZ99_11080 [Alphaproteobacteria bacterium]|nr:MAG: hypothetical protein EAZ99_11080 [Alphaproteobacteria bacterium]
MRDAAALVEPITTAQRIDVTALVEQRVRAVRVGHRPQRPLGPMVQGHPPQRAMVLAPMLFNLCGVAHAVAAAGAIEAASGVEVSPAEASLRRIAVLAEAMVGHGWTFAIDAPHRLGLAPPAEQLAALKRATDGLGAMLGRIQPGGRRQGPDPASLHRAVDHIEDALADLIGLAADEDASGIEAWVAAGACPAARVVRYMRSVWPAGQEGCAMLLEERPAAWWVQQLQQPGFTRCPTLDGDPAETGPFARLAHDPALAALVRVYGAVPWVRMAARALDAAWLPAQLRLEIDDLGPVDAVPVPQTATGAGVGVVETARGTLVHGCWLEGGRIADWRIVAPTEWTFHPDGALTQLLLDLPDDHALPDRMAVAVTCLDACVPVALAIRPVAEEAGDA